MLWGLSVGDRSSGPSVMIAPNGEGCLSMFFSPQSGHVQIMSGIQAGATFFFCFFFVEIATDGIYLWGEKFVLMFMLHWFNDVLLGVHVLHQRRLAQRNWRIFLKWVEVGHYSIRGSVAHMQVGFRKIKSVFFLEEDSSWILVINDPLFLCANAH